MKPPKVIFILCFEWILEARILKKDDLSVRQSRSFQNYHEIFAIDNNLKSMACAEGAGLISIWAGVAWWQAKLNQPAKIFLVTINLPKIMMFAETFISISVELLLKSVLEKDGLFNSANCGYMKETIRLRPGDKRLFHCESSKKYSYVLVRKVKTISTSAKLMCMSEVYINVDE